MRFSDVFRELGMDKDARDYDFAITCACGHATTLGAANFTESGETGRYNCDDCGELLAVVERPTKDGPRGPRGFIVGSSDADAWMLRNRFLLAFQPLGAARPVMIPPSDF